MKSLLLITSFFIVTTSFSQSSLIDYANIYIVIADSGLNFTEMDSKAYAVSKVLDVNYFVNKTFDANKGLVYSDEFINENKHDFIEYAHRRFATNDVSVERATPYFDTIPNKFTMIIVGGMFTKKEMAEKVLFEVKAFFPDAFIQVKEMYLGCDY